MEFSLRSRVFWRGDNVLKLAIAQPNFNPFLRDAHRDTSFIKDMLNPRSQLSGDWPLLQRLSFHPQPDSNASMV